jgi:predicted SAM-dependent methyltransferase
MKLYLGSRDYAPAGFLTVDIDDRHNPDIVADVRDLSAIPTGGVEAICASHILEHIAWPDGFKALWEWVRVLEMGGLLQIAIPDIELLAEMIMKGGNQHYAVGMIYGLGQIVNPLEAHRFGYSRQMLVEVLGVLGMGDFDWWSHAVPDASNGWTDDPAGGRVAISFNLQARKTGEPLVDPAALLTRMAERPGLPVAEAVASLAPDAGPNRGVPTVSDRYLMQRMHYQLIEANQRIKYLEAQESSRR